MGIRKYNNYEIVDKIAKVEINNNTLGKIYFYIDVEDLYIINIGYWNVRIDKRHPNCTLYVESRIKRKRVHLHRLIMNCPENKIIDHIDGNGLNNIKSNLRICTHKLNNLNRKNASGQSGNVGVFYNKRDNLWIASISISGKTKYICYSRDKEEVIRYREKVNKLIEKGDIKSILKMQCKKVDN